MHPASGVYEHYPGPCLTATSHPSYYHYHAASDTTLFLFYQQTDNLWAISPVCGDTDGGVAAYGGTEAFQSEDATWSCYDVDDEGEETRWIDSPIYIDCTLYDAEGRSGGIPLRLRETSESVTLERESVAQEPLRVLISGEPRPQTPLFNADVAILAGGSNLVGKAFYLPLLAMEAPWSYSLRGTRVETRPIDVLYRSSTCAPRRERTVSVIRTAVIAAGFSFVASGACQTTVRERVRSWYECPECGDATVVLAVENYVPGSEYLSEKVFLAIAHGSLPVYVGNGERLLRQAGVNMDRVLVGASGDANIIADEDLADEDIADEDVSQDIADENIARRVVELLRDRRRVEEMGALGLWAEGVTGVVFDLARIRAFTCSSEKVKKLRKDGGGLTRGEVCVSNEMASLPRVNEWLQEALCLDGMAVRYGDCGEGLADVIVSGCCW